jgi:hypothetical protein
MRLREWVDQAADHSLVWVGVSLPHGGRIDVGPIEHLLKGRPEERV